MIIREEIENGLIKTYSDKKVMIKGGFPEGLYIEAIDPKELNRSYIETDEPIPEDELA